MLWRRGARYWTVRAEAGRRINVITESGQALTMDGEAVIPRSNVAFYQVVPTALPEIGA